MPPKAGDGARHGVPLVSVVIPAHNAQAWLADCLASVRQQAGDFALETIVVDDGSTDATAQVASGLAHVICLSQPNRGPAAARNTGIAAARGEFVAFLDADDLWPPGKLGPQVQALQAHPGAALVFGDCRQFDASGPRPLTEFETGGLGASAWGSGGLVPNAHARLLRENFITTGSVVVRRGVLADVGGFAEDLRLVEDLDLWLRIARRHAIAWCGHECLLRRRHALNTSRDPESMSLAYIEVLRRQAAAGEAGHAPLAGTIRRLAAGEYRRMAAAALGRGHIGLALKRAWCSLRPSVDCRAHP